MIARTS